MLKTLNRFMSLICGTSSFVYWIVAGSMDNPDWFVISVLFFILYELEKQNA